MVLGNPSARTTLLGIKQESGGKHAVKGSESSEMSQRAMTFAAEEELQPVWSPP
jgi:hypothetical protein